MSTTEQVDQTIQNIVSVAENISETARSSLTEILQSVEMGNGEAQNNDQNNNASQEKTWGEKYNDAKEYFEKLLPTLSKKKIKKICSFDLSYNTHSGKIMYSIDEPLYIIFEDNTCLMVEYYFVSELRVEYRNLTNEEIGEYEKLDDMFNVKHEIHNPRTYELSHIDTIELEYGYINEIEIPKNYLQFSNEYILYHFVMETNDVYITFEIIE